VALKLNRASRDPGRGVPRRAVSPAWPAGQGCSPAVAPARPLRVPGDVFEMKTRKGRPSGLVRKP